MHTSRISRVLRQWIPLALGITYAMLFATVAVHHDSRQSANDPQIQLTEEAVAKLIWTKPAEVIGSTKIDLRSLAPFVNVYDESGKAIFGSGILDGVVVEPPIGVLTSSQRGRNMVTWEPRPGIRIAAVVETVPKVTGAARGGKLPMYVLAGRSLREIELREQWLARVALLGWAVTMLVTLGAVAAGVAFDKKTEA